MLTYPRCKEMRAEHAAVGGSGCTPEENFVIFGLLRWFLMGKNVATGVYTDS